MVLFLLLLALRRWWKGVTHAHGLDTFRVDVFVYSLNSKHSNVSLSTESDCLRNGGTRIKLNKSSESEKKRKIKRENLHNPWFNIEWKERKSFHFWPRFAFSFSLYFCLHANCDSWRCRMMMPDGDLVFMQILTVIEVSKFFVNSNSFRFKSLSVNFLVN